MTFSNDEAFIAAVRAHLERSENDLDAGIRARLDQARARAVAARNQAAAAQEFVDTLEPALRAQEQLPPSLTSRLDQARRQALAGQAPQKGSGAGLLQAARTWKDSWSALPVGAVASACLVLTVVALFYAVSPPEATLSLDEEIVLVASADDLELYENLDFYLWLADYGLPD